jgi:hypothetical protein
MTLVVATALLFLTWIVVHQWQRNQLSGRRVFTTQVHGIYHDNADGSSRQEIISRCHVGEEVLLVPEPDNPNDPEAVKICRKNGEQIGYWRGYSDLAYRLRIGWTFHVTIDEIYAFEDRPKDHGVRLRVEILTMSRRTEELKRRRAAKEQTKAEHHGNCEQPPQRNLRHQSILRTDNVKYSYLPLVAARPFGDAEAESTGSSVSSLLAASQSSCS